MRDQLVIERQKKELTQEKLGKVLGISTVYVRKIEKGLRNPGRETMLKFETFYGVPARVLFPDLFQVSVDTKRIENKEKQQSNIKSISKKIS